MERRQNTTAGVLFWTPAPAHASPSSTVISEDDWDVDDDEEQAEREDDFVSQMDENGIIGLAEALEDVELEEYNSDGYPGSFTPEEAHPSGCETDGPSEELSYKSAAEDVGKPSSYKLKLWSEDGEERLAAERLDMIKEEKDGEEERGQSHRSDRFEHTSTSGPLGAMVWPAKVHIGKEENKKIRSGQPSSVQPCAVDPVGVSSPLSQSALPVAATTLPHLLHFTAKELNTAPGIDAETFPEMSFTDFPESYSSHMSLNSSSRYSEIKLRASPPPVAVFSEQVISKIGRLSNNSGEEPGKTDEEPSQPTPKPRRTRKHSPEATYSRTHSLSTVRSDSSKSKQNKSCDREPRTPRTRINVGVDECRKGSLSCHTPDFSKVEPRVRFPRGGYKPPKSTLLLTGKSLSPEPPVVFKSPADIVKDILLNTPDGSPTPSECNRQPTSATNAIVPQEFRCRQQATTLLNQLQEDYNRLLTKYAEAENTIDRLRLEAKDSAVENQQPRSRQCEHITGRAVNLYSDPPNPGHSVQSGLNCDASKFLKLDFPLAQKADIRTHQGSSASGPTEPGAQLGQQLANILFSQTDKFLQQMQTFEDLLKSKKLKPFEQTEGTSQLAEGLESLERGYLLARDEHKLLQQRGVEISQFDPERELEGLIFQCGLRMDELKEQVEQMQRDQPTCGTPPSPPPQPTSPSAPSVDVETLTHPQAVLVPLRADPVEAAEADVSSVCKNDDVESEEDDEETLYLNPLTGKTKCTGEDFSMAANHYQSIKELPKLLDHSKKERVLLSAALRTNMQPEDKDRQETGNNEFWKTLPQRNTKSDHQDSPSDVNKQQNSRSSPPPSSSRIMILPVFPHTSSRRVELGKSHSSSQSSLGDIKGSERRSSKVQAASRRVFSQDGIISPETDSGFVGSESSRLTPAAASSPLHQRASESVSVSQEGNKRSPQTGLVSAPSRFSSPSHSHTAQEPSVRSRLSLDRPPRNRRTLRRPTFSFSPQRWVSLREQRVDSGSSEFGLESDSTHTGSEGEESDQYTDSINSLHSSHSSSTAAQYHRDDSPRAGSSSQNCNDAVQTLQVEVTRLKERLEVCLRNKKPVSATRSAPSAQEKSPNHSTASPGIRPGEQQSDVGVDEFEEDSTLRPTARRKSASANQPKPQHDYLTRSEPQPFAPQPHASKCTQTSAAPDSCSSHTTAVHRTRTRHRKHPVDSVSETGGEPDSRGSHAPLCSRCLSSHRKPAERPVGGNREPCHSSTCRCRCPLCGRLETHKVIKPDCRRLSDLQPTESPDRAAERRFFAAAAPPALLQCMPVCPPPLLLYSSPIYISPNRNPTSSRVTGRGEARRTKRRSLSAGREPSLDSSLNKAIRAARHMKHTSRHMARSLASGLQYQELLAQSCSY
ncbi:microtubule organization protein AKNA isoform X2 [Archocentrus centrarchus]|uniref:microtubule organization protein AKNA isoform X2 n=1 Tax=Archocentrus centrarchus TaxID=63155 RepID=UPI0011EA4DDB|nr:microtubule organization protein AKNA isoform X2 [Archocentrus centrarchus]